MSYILKYSLKLLATSIPWKLTCQEFLEAQRNISIPIIIIPFKYIRHSLQHDTALHEQVKTHAVAPALVVGSKEQIDKGG